MELAGPVILQMVKLGGAGCQIQQQTAQEWKVWLRASIVRRPEGIHRVVAAIPGVIRVGGQVQVVATSVTHSPHGRVLWLYVLLQWQRLFFSG